MSRGLKRTNKAERSRDGEIEPDFVFRVSLSVCSVPSVVKGILEWLLLNKSKM